MVVKYTVGYFKDAQGREPVTAYVDSLEPKDKAKYIFIVENHIKVFGPATSKKIMHEVMGFPQIKFFRHRIVAVLLGNQYVFLHAFKKTTQKADVKQFKKAETAFNELQSQREQQNG